MDYNDYNPICFHHWHINPLTTPLSNAYSWFIPIFIMCLGILFMKNGFPTTQTVRNIAKKLSGKFSKKEEKEYDINLPGNRKENNNGNYDDQQIRAILKLDLDCTLPYQYFLAYILELMPDCSVEILD